MPTIEDLGKAVKAKYPDAYKDMSDADVGQKVKAKFPGAYDDFEDKQAGMPLLAHKPSDASMRAPTQAERVRETGQQVGEAALDLAPLAVGFMPGFGEAGLGLKMGAQFAAGAGKSLVISALKSTLGGEKVDLGEAGKRALGEGALQATFEAIPAGIGKMVKGAKEATVGLPATEETKRLFRIAGDLDARPSVADFRPSAFTAMQRYFEGSIFGRAGGSVHEAQFLDSVARGANRALDAIDATSRLPAQGAKAGADALGIARQEWRRVNGELYRGLFSEANVAAGGQAMTKLDSASFAKMKGITATMRQVADKELDMAPDARKINSLVEHFTEPSGSTQLSKAEKANFQVALKNAETKLATDPNNPQVKQQVSELKGMLGIGTNMPIEVAHEVQSELGEIARTAKSTKVRLAAKDLQKIVRDSIDSGLRQLPDGDQFVKRLATAHVYTRKGATLFNNSVILSAAHDQPEALIRSLRNPEDIWKFKDVKRALRVYGQDEPGWKMVKRMWFQDQLNTLAMESAGESAKPALDFAKGIQKLSARLKANPELAQLMGGDDPATRAAMQRFQDLSTIIEKKGPLAVKSSHFGTFYTLHLMYGAGAAMAGASLGYKEGGAAGAVVGASSGIMLTALAPAGITKLMYSKVGSKMFLTGFDNVLTKLGRGLQPTASDFAQISRAVEYASQDRSAKIPAKKPGEVYVDPNEADQ